MEVLLACGLILNTLPCVVNFGVQLTSFRVTFVWICELLQVDSKTGAMFHFWPGRDPVCGGEGKGEGEGVRRGGEGEGEGKVPNFFDQSHQKKKAVCLCAESP